MIKQWLIKLGKIVALLYTFFPIIVILEKYSKDILSICIGLLMTISYCFFLFVALEKMDNKPTNTSINKQDEEWNNLYSELQKTKNKAKQDLATGVKKEELDEMLKKGYITQDVYNETLDSIKALEMLENFDIDEFKNNNEESTKN